MDLVALMEENQMSTDPRIALRQTWTDRFYWIGMAMSVLCVALAWARNTALMGRFEHPAFPLSWAAGVIAIVAFLASEHFHPAPPAKKRAPRRVPEPLAELQWETEFADR